MTRGWVSLPGVAILLLAACQAPSASPAPGAGMAPAAAAPAAPATRELRVTDRAPDFMLRDQNRQEVRLSQFRGRPVQVAFYVSAFSGT